ncbi:unnamed protein product [Arabidopsis halleri]
MLNFYPPPSSSSFHSPEQTHPNPNSPPMAPPPMLQPPPNLIDSTKTPHLRLSISAYHSR